MFKIAIVEDNGAAAEELRNFLTRCAMESNKTFDIAVFGDVVSFLDNYENIYDMVFTDIELPYINGMEAAKRLRVLDRQVMLIFVTNVARYAVKDYEVDTSDYLVKPIHYENFELKLRRAILRCSGDQEAVLVVRQNDFLRLKLRGIHYIEVGSHTLIFHTGAGSIQGNEMLLETEGKLKGKGFLRCNKYYLVNRKHITAVRGCILVMIDGEELQISRPRKKTSISELAGTLRSEYVL